MAFKVGSTTVVDDNGKVAASQLDITNATAESSIVGADEVLVYDASAGEIRKATITNSALVGPTGPTGPTGSTGSQHCRFMPWGASDARRARGRGGCA